MEPLRLVKSTDVHLACLVHSIATMRCCRRHKLITIFVSFFLLVTAVAPSIAIEEERKLGNWIGATSSLRYTDEWSLFLQGELRTWEMVSNLNELLWRADGLYYFNKRYMGAVGYVRTSTSVGNGKVLSVRLEARWTLSPFVGTGHLTPSLARKTKR